MKAATDLIDIVEQSETDFMKLSPADWSKKIRPDKWSKKEILGHLIDSALTNLRRFIVTQYRENDKIIYHQNEWVKFQDYQHADIDELILLWRLLNKQIARVIHAIPSERMQNTCDSGQEKQELRTLEFLATDYVSHLQHHLSQISGAVFANAIPYVV